MSEQEDISQAGLEKANQDQVEFSDHGAAMGAAGFVDPETTGSAYDHLGKAGDTISVAPGPDGFGKITVAALWDNTATAAGGLMDKILGTGIDLDLGCLYELQDGQRGAVQAFGKMMGSFDQAPYMTLSGDEKTGDKQGDDEWIKINGAQWPKIKRLLFYVYIYDGASNWSQFKPQIQVRIPGQKPMVVTIASPNDEMDICAIAGIENVRNGMALKNYTEYFPGQAEMDRAFGFGLEWSSGEKA